MEEEKVPRKPKKQALRPEDSESTTQDSVVQPEKYYKKFDFFYKRTCFRLMAEFFKLLFQPFQKQWIEQKKRFAMSNLMQAFAAEHFSPLL
jgi:hypothetical protein